MKRNELYRLIFKSVLNVVDILVYITLSQIESSISEEKISTLSVGQSTWIFVCFSYICEAQYFKGLFSYIFS